MILTQSWRLEGPAFLEVQQGGFLERALSCLVDGLLLTVPSRGETV